MNPLDTSRGSASRLDPQALDGRAAWQLSWPLIAGVYAFLLALHSGHVTGLMLSDGDTYWHIATGRWILEHLSIPFQDPFSNSMRGEPWVAKEWVSQIILARSHDLGGWEGVVAVTGLAFAATFAILCRALLHELSPIRAVSFTAVAVLMVVTHLLARPFVLAMPLMMVWMIELFAAADERRAPPVWLLPLMALWANMHGGFTLGLAVAAVLAAEVVLASRDSWRSRGPARSWCVFLVLATASAMLTPQGPRGLWFTWQVMVQDSYALSRISEWSSPNFHVFQPLLIWLLGAMGLVFWQGLRLPIFRLVLVLGLLALALKHVRNVELLGLIAPLAVARPFSRQWRAAGAGWGRPGKGVLALDRLAAPAGLAASVAAVVLLAAACLALNQLRPAKPPEVSMPAGALQAVRSSHLQGRVLNDYGWGGGLIYAGIAPFIDGRQDLYRDQFMRTFIEALELKDSDSLQNLLAHWQVQWTLLRPGTPAVALLDSLPGWHRLYTDEHAIVHVRDGGANGPGARPAGNPQ